MSEIFTDASGHELLIRMENAGFFMRQLAANIITDCNKLPIGDFGMLGSFTGGSPATLTKYPKWSNSGYINAFQSQVQLVYNFMEAVIDGRAKLIWEHGDERLFPQAMQSYQDWKTAKIKHDKANFGENWGDATGFNQMDWTDQNEKFIKTVVGE